MSRRVSRLSLSIRLIRLGKVLFRTWQTGVRINRVRDPESANGKLEVRRHTLEWTNSILKTVGITVTAGGVTPLKEPCLYVSNHMGFLDVPILLKVVDVGLVAKSEVSKWMIFGKAATAGGTVFVERSNPESRKNTAEALARNITQKSRSMGIFPEGTSSSHGKTWKKGTFFSAAQYGFPIQPIRIAYKPHRDCCYINRDHLMTKMWDLLGHDHIEADVEFLEPVRVSTPDAVDALVAQTEKKVQDSLTRKLNEWGLTLEPFED